MLLKTLITKSASIDVGRITILLGAANVGKSELLRDIFRLMINRDPAEPGNERDDDVSTVVLDDLEYVANLSADRILDSIRDEPVEPQRETPIGGLGPDLNSAYETVVQGEVWSALHRPTLAGRALMKSRLAEVFALKVAFADAGVRSQMVTTGPSCSPAATPKTALQVLERAPADVRQQFEAAFFEVFRQEIRLDDTERVLLSLRIGDRFPDRAEDPVAAVHQLAAFDALDTQGVAYRDGAASLLSLVICPGRVLLLDEPAAHLHPEQAERLGAWIGRNAQRLDSQVVITTSSEALVAGLVGHSDEVSMAQLTRSAGISGLSAVSPPATNRLSKSPFLSRRELLESLFHRRVVITESDEDRAIYQLVAERQHARTDAAFVHAHGQQNLSVVVELLRSAEIPGCVVADLDVLKTRPAFVELVRAATGKEPQPSWLTTRDKLEASVRERVRNRELSINASEMEEALRGFAGGGEIIGADAFDQPTEPADAERARENWARVRERGLDAIEDDFRPWVEQLLDELQAAGIFIVPKGQLQGWIDFGDQQSREDWFFNAAGDLDLGECPGDLESFVGQVLDYLDR